MPLDPELLSLMAHEVTIEAFVSRDAWGNRTYGTVIACPARIVQRRRLITSVKGENVISNTQIYAATTQNVKLEDRLTLPSGFIPRQPPILMVHRLTDEYGMHHTVIFA